ncbi:unnamed protein product [Pleuronectes platessa]|uniref:Uncharacterized protein n=1 Tax=Pleuronectes platessa TaxID=8262 RepID=A0A9N7YPG5_PLEPL|nr:unnamed protein product [Pleuronectes platessa]
MGKKPQSLVFKSQLLLTQPHVGDLYFVLIVIIEPLEGNSNVIHTHSSLIKDKSDGKTRVKKKKKEKEEEEEEGTGERKATNHLDFPQEREQDVHLFPLIGQSITVKVGERARKTRVAKGHIGIKPAAVARGLKRTSGTGSTKAQLVPLYFFHPAHGALKDVIHCEEM